MSDLNGLLRAVIEHPDDDTVRLVFADCLQEVGQEDRAEFIRVQVELASRGKWYNPRCAREQGKHYVQCGHGDIEAVACVDCWKAERTRESALLAVHPDWLPPCPVCGAKGRVQFTDNHGPHDYYCDRCSGTGRIGRHSRGFIESLTCTAEQFLEHAEALIWRPEQTVECRAKGCNEGSVGRPKPGNVGGQWFGRMCNKCEGTGRVPRPCPDTAHPITDVTLTTLPEGWSFQRPRDSDGPWFHDKYPGVRFRFKLTVTSGTAGTLAVGGSFYAIDTQTTL